jgi:hypothetical protein
MLAIRPASSSLNNRNERQRTKMNISEAIALIHEQQAVIGGEQFHVIKCNDAPKFNEENQTYDPVAPAKHEYLRVKPKAKDSKAVYWILPKAAEQIELAYDQKDAPIIAMLFDLFDQQRKIWIAALESGKSEARKWLVHIANGAERYFVHGRTLGVKPSDIDEWIGEVLQPYMVGRLAKNAGFTEVQKTNLVNALVLKFKIANTKDNLVTGKDGKVAQVPLVELEDLQKRLEQYRDDANNPLAVGEEYEALLAKIRKHQKVEVANLEDVRNMQF